jgi:hypothetical protein
LRAGPEGRCIRLSQLYHMSTPANRFSNCVRIDATPRAQGVFKMLVGEHLLTMPRAKGAAVAQVFERQTR